MKYFGQIATTKEAEQQATIFNSEDTDSEVINSLSEEQKAVIEELRKGHSVVVDSVIGSGKTRTLQAICDAFPNKRILYLTYNKLLKLDAQEKIKNRNVTVQNYHGFVYKYLVRRGLQVEPSKQIEAFLEKCSDIPLVYDIVLTDEYQDIEDDTAALLLHIAKECPNAQWVFVGDMAQKIYDKTKIDVYKDCIEKIIPDYVPLSFTQSFRISAEHGEFLSSMWSKHIEGVNAGCKVGTITSYKDLLELVDETPNKDLLILGPRYGLTQELVNMLERHDPKKYNKQTVWTSIRDRDEHFKIQPDSLIVTTYDGCKGMERDVCIVIDWTNTHFKNRVEKPFVDQNIIRNLFCVAASRGKSKIMFYRDTFLAPPKEHLLMQEDLTLSYTQQLPTYEPSNMFAFKHPVDLLRCLESLKIEEIPQEDTSEIRATSADGNIDLAPAIGIYQEITFFKNYSFQRTLDSLEDKPILNRIKKWIAEQSALTDEQKALALTAYSTELFRYCNQANPQFISPEEHQKLLDRLNTKLNPATTKIQVGKHLVADFTAQGYIDYIDDKGIPWELKFVANLSNENILQAAIYSLMCKASYAYLWNTRTNDLRKITVTNREKFLSDVYTCITMGRKLRRH